MMKLRNLARLTTLTAALAVSAFALVGCDVDAEAPEVPEVEVTGGELPKLDVEMADVDLPSVDIDVEGGDIDMPEEGDTEAGQSEAKQELEAETGH